MAGAGVAAPLVPLAREIILACGGSVPDAAKRVDGEAWAKCFSDSLLERYPTRALQRKFISQLTNDDGPISEASYLLGYHLASCAPASFVCTTNFDRMIARVAYMLSTKMVSIGENPTDAPKFDIHELRTPQLLHIHGVAWAYDIKAIYKDIQRHSRDVSDLLKSLLNNRPVMVIGYAGWESDVFMTALKETLEKPSPLKQLVIWFLYKRSDFESLPKWLRESGDPAVIFVMPEERTAHHINDPVLDAAVVLNAITDAISLAPPWLVSNPMMFTAHRIRSMIDHRKTGASLTCAALPAAKQTIRTLLRAARHEKTATHQRSLARKLQDQLEVSLAKNQLDDMINNLLLRRSIKVLQKMPIMNLDQIWALLQACSQRVEDNSPLAIRLFEAGELVSACAIKREDCTESSRHIWMQRGFEYHRKKLRWHRIKGELSSVELLEKYRILSDTWSRTILAGSSDPEHVMSLAKCLLAYAQIREQNEEWSKSKTVSEKATRCLRHVISRTQKDSQMFKEANLFLAYSLRSLALSLTKQGQFPTAQTVYDELEALSAVGDLEIDGICSEVHRMVFDRKRRK